jgi:FtsP/CotA-like multicopper oxidase with cupredoxin domain
MLLRRLLPALGGLLLVALLGFLAWSWWESRLPGSYNVMEFGEHDYGGGPPVAMPVVHGRSGHEHAAAHPISVANLRGPVEGEPDRRFTLTATKATVQLGRERTVDALTFDGRVPGPELRVRKGDLVEVTLVNRDVEPGVTIHWHGVDVPNAEDGVAGVTQNAVQPGGRHVYRFRVEQEGSFWYHTHQSSGSEVRRGLFGAFVIEPESRPTRGKDIAVVAHEVGGRPALNESDGVAHEAVRPDTPVRLRLVNTNNTPRTFRLVGAPFRVVAIDGSEVVGPTSLDGRVGLEVAGGGRYDVAFTMPAGAVGLQLADTGAGLALSPDGRSGLPPTAEPETEFDPLTYGRPARTPFTSSSRFDRTFAMDLGRKPGFLDGRPGFHWTINGGIFPDVPVFIVERGDLVKVTIDNGTDAVHPMHLHGQHVLVLSRDGEAASGSPWWSDTLNVEAGERYEVAFRADNPGIWMDHCHNLRHAAEGLTMHLAYAQIDTPFRAGDDTHNHPE